MKDNIITSKMTEADQKVVRHSMLELKNLISPDNEAIVKVVYAMTTMIKALENNVAVNEVLITKRIVKFYNDFRRNEQDRQEYHVSDFRFKKS